MTTRTLPTRPRIAQRPHMPGAALYGFVRVLLACCSARRKTSSEQQLDYVVLSILIPDEDLVARPDLGVDELIEL
jgi:hypothetical protein